LFPLLGCCSDDLIPFWVDVSSLLLNALRDSTVVFTVVGADSFFKLHGCGCSGDLVPSSLNTLPCTLCTCIRPRLYHRLTILLLADTSCGPSVWVYMPLAPLQPITDMIVVFTTAIVRSMDQFVIQPSLRGLSVRCWLNILSGCFKKIISIYVVDNFILFKWVSIIILTP
jgi:hypothetical protein